MSEKKVVVVLNQARYKTRVARFFRHAKLFYRRLENQIFVFCILWSDLSSESCLAWRYLVEFY